MQEKSDFILQIEDILARQAFDELAPFSTPQAWQARTQEEQEVLAAAQIAHAKKRLDTDQDADQAIAVLDLAAAISPANPKILYHQVLLLTSHPHNRLFLLRANRLLEEVLALLPEFFEGWYTWGNVQLNMGILSKDPAFLYEADQKYSEAFSFWKPPINPAQREYFWHWGLCWQMIAKHSGEASDYHKAIKKYRQAVEDGLTEPRFCNSFGNALFDLGLLISRSEYILEAIEWYRKAVAAKPIFPEAWFNLACCYQRVFQNTLQDDFFMLANSSFQEASQQDPNHPNIWCKWGMLETYAGKLNHNLEMLQQSLEKFAIADRLQPRNPQFLSGWAEALMLIGSQEERIDLLRDAEQKINLAIELAPNQSHFWYIAGTTLNEIARYFSDAKYYEKAIEKFQFGISLDRTDHLLWYGLALAHYAIGELRQDTAMIEKAVRYCSRVIEFGGEMLPHFWNDWGVALMKLGVLNNDKRLVQSAVEKFEQALSRHHEHHGADGVDAEWLYNYGCALDFLGDFNDDERYYEKAIQVLAQAIALDPSYTHARYNLALALTHLGEITSEAECLFKANDLFQAIIAQDAEDEMSWNDWGLCLLHLADLLHDPGQPDQAAKLYHQAEHKFLHAAALGNTQSLYNLACLHTQTGNIESAMHYIERADTTGGLPPMEDILHDEWLEPLRQTPQFKNFLLHLSAKKQQES